MLLFAVVIVSVLVYFNLIRPTPKIDEASQEAMTRSGIDNRNYETTLNSMLLKVKSLEQMQLDRAERYTDNFFNEHAH